MRSSEVRQHVETGETPVYRWDPYSDQPYKIRDKRIKRRIRLQSLPDYLKLLPLLLVLPVNALLAWLLPQGPKRDTSRFFGLCVNLNREADQARAMLDELQVEEVLVRFSLADMGSLAETARFMEGLGSRRILVAVLQDRQHVEDLRQLEEDLHQVFTVLSPLAAEFQIGNAINRIKWGFNNPGEYLSFYEVAQRVRDRAFPDILLSGSGVIDFEVFPLLRTLFNGRSIRFDRLASLLYVDRRGAPENRQGGYDLRAKIRAIAAAMRLSRKSSGSLIITETNWPLKHTGKYAPAHGRVCVEEADAARFLVRYYLLSLTTGYVDRIYWHQLVAPGYGLVDNRKGEIRKREAYFAFKAMRAQLAGATLIKTTLESDGLHELVFRTDTEQVRVCWSLRPQAWLARAGEQVFDQSGQALPAAPEQLSGSVIYARSPLSASESR